MPELTPILTEDDIKTSVSNLARRISSDYAGRELILIGVLKGAFVFLSDLIRRLSIPVRVDFICAASYGSHTVSSGNIRLTKTVDIDIENRDVLLVEDIADTGLTLSRCADYIRSLSPRTLKICAMIDKYQRRECDINIDYTCHETKEGFLVGYGLDYDEKYRELPGIYRLDT
ncbi:MAG: hypoxanthine phosphoribosyltransferase [Desulfobacterales bacterium]